jgi:hypothetical protein
MLRSHRQLRGSGYFTKVSLPTLLQRPLDPLHPSSVSFVMHVPSLLAVSSHPSTDHTPIDVLPVISNFSIIRTSKVLSLRMRTKSLIFCNQTIGIRRNTENGFLDLYCLSLQRDVGVMPSHYVFRGVRG